MALLIVICLVGPLPLWLMEQIWPFPYLIEEVFKFGVVKYAPIKNNWWYPIIFGVVFSVSESILYMINFLALGNFSNLPIRLISTTVLHTGLFVGQYACRGNKMLSLVGLAVAIGIHYIYNLVV